MIKYIDGTLTERGKGFKYFMRLLGRAGVKFEIRHGRWIRSKKLGLSPIEVAAIRQGARIKKKTGAIQRYWVCAEYLGLDMWTVVDLLLAENESMHTLENSKTDRSRAIRYKKLMMKYLKLKG